MVSEDDDSNTDAQRCSFEVKADLTAKREPAMTVVRSVATVKDRSVTDLPPLANTIDTEALNRLFDHPGTANRADIDVTFTYAAVSITISGPGTVRIDSVPE